MRIHVEVKDVVVYALIILLAATMFVRFAKIEAALQTIVLVKTVNDQGAVLQDIVKFLNGKPWAVPPAKGTDLVNTPKTK